MGVVGYRPGGCRNCLVVLLSGALIVVLIALIAVTALHSHTVRTTAALRNPKSESYGYSEPVCRRPDCLRLAGSLLQNTNRSADPCNDFFSYSCGAYVANRRHDKWRTFTQTTRQDMGATLFAAMNQVLRFPELRRQPFSSLKRRLAEFYESCLSDSDPRPPPVRIPWRDRKWLDLNFLLTGRAAAKMLSAEQIVARLLLYRAPFLLQLGPYDENLDVVGLVPLALQLRLKSPVCAGTSVRPMTRALVQLTAQKMSSEEEAGLEKTAELGCRALANTTASFANVSSASVNATPAALIAAEEGKDPAFSLRRFFSSLVELGALTPDSLDRLRFDLQPGSMTAAAVAFAARMRAAGPEAFANFAALHLVVTRAKFMGRDVQAVVRRYLPDVATSLFELPELKVEATVENFESWQKCLTIVSSQMPALMTRAYADEYLPPDQLGRVERIAQATRVAFAANLKGTGWLEKADKEAALRKVKTLGINIGYPAIFRDDAFLEAVMGDMNVSSTNYNWNYIRTAYLATKWRLAELAAGRQELWSQLELQTLSVQAYYVPELNHVFITAGILQPPIVYTDIPDQFLLAGVGFVIGHEIGHAFDPYGHETPFGQKQAVAWNISSLTEERYHDRLPCLEASYAEIPDDTGLFNKSRRSNSSLGNDLADVTGMRAIVAAFEALSEKDGRWRLPGFEDLSPMQTLLLHSVQLFCSAPTKRFYDTIYYPSHSPDFMRVSGPLRNVPAFATAFRCRPETFMNPAQRCHFF